MGDREPTDNTKAAAPTAPPATDGSMASEGESHVRDLYNRLRTGERGVGFEAFVREFYFLQHRHFTIFDVKEAFQSSTESSEHYLSYRDFQYALIKIARAHHVPGEREMSVQDETDANLVAALIDEVTQKRPMEGTEPTSSTRRMDTLRRQLTKHGTLSVLETHLRKIIQSFQLYGKDNRAASSRTRTGQVIPVQALDTTSSISLDGFVDFLNAYFEYEEFFSFGMIEQMAREVVEAYRESQPTGDEWEMIFPEFLELFCRVASHFHIRTLEKEGAQLRRAVESCRLEFSVELLLEKMNIQIFKDDGVDSTRSARVRLTSMSVNEIDEYESGMDGLTLVVDAEDSSNATMSSILVNIRTVLEGVDVSASVKRARQPNSILFARLPPRKGNASEERQHAKYVPEISDNNSWDNFRIPCAPPEVTLIREVIVPPPLPPNILKRLEYAITYQNIGQYNMALGALHACRKQYQEWRGAAHTEIEVLLYFALMLAGVYDSARKDHRALVMYQEALRHSELLPLQHPGRALVRSSLGCMLYYLNELSLAKRCHEQVLDFRKKAPEFGEEHVDTATAMNNLACCLSRDTTGTAIEEAYLHLKAAKRIYTGAFGTSHPRVEIVTRNFDRVLASQRMVVGDPVGAMARGEYKHIIAGSRFQIKALVPVQPLGGGGKKKKKKGKGKGKGTKKKK